MNLVLIFTNPWKFFSLLKKEKTIKESFSFLLIVTLIVQFIVVFYYVKRVFPLYNIYIELTITKFILIYLFVLITSVISVFVTLFILHLFVLMVGGKGTFADTFKCIVYGSIPNYLISPILIILSLFFAQNILVSIIIILISVPALIYSYYLYLLGLSVYHKISRLKVFVGIFVIPFVLMIFLVIILFFIFASFMANKMIL